MLSLPPKKFSSDMAHYQSKIGNCLYLHWYTGTCWSRLPAFRGGWNPLGHPGGLAAGLMQLSILSFMPFPRAYLRLRLAMIRTRTILRTSRLSTPLDHRRTISHIKFHNQAENQASRRVWFYIYKLYTFDSLPSQQELTSLLA